MPNGLTEEQKQELAILSAAFVMKYNIPVPELQRFVADLLVIIGLMPKDRTH